MVSHAESDHIGGLVDALEMNDIPDCENLLSHVGQEERKMSQPNGKVSISDELHTTRQWMRDEIIDCLKEIVKPSIILARFGKVSPDEIEILEDAVNQVHKQITKSLTIRTHLIDLRTSWLKLTASRSTWFNRRGKRRQQINLVQKLLVERDNLVGIGNSLGSVRDILHKAESKNNDKEFKDHLITALEALNNLDRKMNAMANKLKVMSQQMEDHEI